jgi:hypothetical protein
MMIYSKQLRAFTQSLRVLPKWFAGMETADLQFEPDEIKRMAS